jgi:hypothetical protein
VIESVAEYTTEVSRPEPVGSGAAVSGAVWKTPVLSARSRSAAGGRSWAHRLGAMTRAAAAARDGRRLFIREQVDINGMRVG